MSSFVDHFHEGGPPMFATLVCGVFMLGVAVRYAVTPEKRFVPLLMGLGVLTLATGALGFVTGLIVTCGAIGSEQVEATRRSLITIVGFGESLNNLAFALIFVVLAAVCGSYGAYRLSSAGDTSAASG